MRTEQERVILAQLTNQFPRLNHLYRVDTNRRFVENQHVRFVQNRLRDSRPLPESLREFADERIAIIIQANRIDDLGDPLIYPRPVHSTQTSHVVQIVRNRHIQVQRHRFGQISDVPTCIERVGNDVVPGDYRVATGRWRVSSQHTHRRRLASPVRTQETNDLTLQHLKRNVENCRVGPVVLRHVLKFDHDLFCLQRLFVSLGDRFIYARIGGKV